MSSLKRPSLITVLIIAAALAVAGQTTAHQVETPAKARSGVSYGLLVDNSGSFRTIFERVINLAGDVIDESGPLDEGFLLTFVDTPKIVLRQDFTSSKSELHDAAENMYIEGGQTAILDAVKAATEHINEKAEFGSRALILITDGEERDSRSSAAEVLTLLKASNVRVYVLGISESKVTTKLIDQLTKGTGGMKFLPRNTAEMKNAVKEIFVAIHSK